MSRTYGGGTYSGSPLEGGIATVLPSEASPVLSFKQMEQGRKKQKKNKKKEQTIFR